MYKQTNVYASTCAEASISINKNKVKSYDGNFYLQNGQEFQIELFNPTQTTKLAKISINGNWISTSGIVLKPGQRIYLDRFIDTPKKFKFEIYEVNLTDAEVLKAIANNGDVQVSFYDEQEEQKPYYYGGLPQNHQLDQLDIKYRHSPMYTNTLNSSSLISKRMDAILSNECSMSVMDSLQETGRVEKGSHSNQDFTHYSGKFNSWATNTVYMKILPVSAKPLEVKDLATYCTNCGTRNKAGNYKFCPSCGNKY